MTRVAVDFGTSNTVLAHFDEATGQAKTVEIPDITRAITYRLDPESEAETVHVVPSLIYYGEQETLIGNQVLTSDLLRDRNTLRWVKRRIALGVTKRSRTPHGHRSPAEAGEDFLRLLLSYISSDFSFAADEFTFTVPVEAFEDFEDWLRRVTESLGIARVRVIDEATSCILGYQGAVKPEDRFMVFDFGSGTLDVATVRVDTQAQGDRRAIQLGQAGRDLGGMDIDTWIFDEFCTRTQMDERSRRTLEPQILAEAERVKVRLSDPVTARTELRVTTSEGDSQLELAYQSDCQRCDPGSQLEPPDASTSCLGCLLRDRVFIESIRETVDRAFENAAIKAGVRRDDISRVFVTGGTSLIPGVRRYLQEAFGSRLGIENPFDAVVRGACQGIVVPILQHDYAIESFNRSTRDYEFKPLFRVGTSYPTPANAVRFWARGSYNGMTRIGIKIFEVSQMKRRSLDVSLVDWEGALRDTSQVNTENHYICLNRESLTFIIADPPVDLDRDEKRFLCSFTVDGQRRLLVTVSDQLNDRELLREYPVVRL